MSDSQQKSDLPKLQLVKLENIFPNTYFRKGEPHDRFVCATAEGEEVMIAKRCSDGSTHFEPVSPEHSYTAQTFTKVRFDFDTLLKGVRE